MSEFVEVMKQKKRMCDTFGENCSRCGLSLHNNGIDKLCENFFKDHPKAAEEIIMNWAKENPIITNADKFKEVFGLEHVGGCNGIKWECDFICDMCNFKNFWNEKYKEPSEA